jgi:quercetin dioxygenase-like cupin family protein
MQAQIFNYLGDGMSGICLIDAEASGGTFSLFRLTTAHGAGVPPHVHQNEDEVFYILEGSYRLQLGERRFEARAGEVAYLPRTIAHSFECASEAGGEMLVMTLPGGFEAFFTELDAFGPLPTPPSQEDIERFVTLLGRHGMTPVAPH